MFHRVKSEVQDTEQNTPKESGLSSHSDGQRVSARNQGQETQAQPSSTREENESPRVYGRNSVEQQQEETPRPWP